MRRYISALLRHPACILLAIYYMAVLMIPNISLCITESMGVLASVANLFLPLGFYMVFVSLFSRTGWAVWCMLPFSVLAAFQIVLLFLYGGSIIAVDMFLNVVTTNMSEACELLANLGTAIVTVVLLYLPPLVWATVTIVRRKVMMPGVRRCFRLTGLVIMLTGCVVGCLCSFTRRGFSVTDDVFPVNVINNIGIAVERTVDLERYGETSAPFSYGAVSTHDNDMAEVYVMVIGETSRACNWQLGGYGRLTNPCLSKRQGLTFFSKALSESNTTHKSVPMLMSHVSACNYDSLNYSKSVITAFKEAGFHTTFISNQAPNRSYTQFFGEEADRVVYLADTLGRHRYDGEMLPLVEACLADTVHRKQFVVLHSYGSHFKYAERYPESASLFKPDVCEEVTGDSRDMLVNAYDNSILYTDMWLDNLMGLLDDSGRLAALVYSADHGEDIMDDSRGRFLHASPTPTYYQLHVAMLTWVSASYGELYQDKLEAMRSHACEPVSSTVSLYNTLIDLGGIDTRYYDREASLASENYHRGAVLYVNDRNEGVGIDGCGLKKVDFDLFDKFGLL